MRTRSKSINSCRHAINNGKKNRNGGTMWIKVQIREKRRQQRSDRKSTERYVRAQGTRRQEQLAVEYKLYINENYCFNILLYYKSGYKLKQKFSKGTIRLAMIYSAEIRCLTNKKNEKLKHFERKGIIGIYEIRKGIQIGRTGQILHQNINYIMTTNLRRCHHEHKNRMKRY